MVSRIFLLFALVATAASASAAERVGRVVALSGAVSVRRAKAPPAVVARGDHVYQGDIIETGKSGNVRLLMRDKSVLALAPNSGLAIADYAVKPKTKKRRARLTVLLGRLWAFVSRTDNPDASYEVKTQTAVAGVRGTELVFDVDESGNAEVTVIQGEVRLASEASKRTIGVEQQGRVQASGNIDLSRTTNEAIADMRQTVEPERVLDRKTAARRLQVTKKKTETETVEPAAAEKADESAASSRLFEDAEQNLGSAEDRQDSKDGNDGIVDAPTGGEQDGSVGPGPDFDPATMARVHLSVEVRP